MGERLLAEARRALEQGRLEPYFEVRTAAGWHHIPVPEPVMDSPVLRSVLFDKLRTGCDAQELTAVVLVTALWAARLTEAGLALASTNPREIERLVGERHFERLVARGLAVREQAVEVIIQTPADTLVIHQPYDSTAAGGVLFGPRHDGDYVEGRMSMWGPRESSFRETGAVGKVKK